MTWQKRVFIVILVLSVSFMGALAWGQSPVQLNPLRTAQAKVRASQVDIDRMERKAKADLAKQADWVKAQDAAGTAAKTRDAAKETALRSTQKSPAYLAATIKLKESEAIIAAEDSGRATAKQVEVATSDAIDARLVISQLESAALKQSAEYQDAVMRHDAANAVLAEKWEAYRRDTLENNRDYRAALAKKDVAEQELKTAQDSARVARAQMAAQQQTVRPQRSTPRNSGTSSQRMRGGY